MTNSNKKPLIIWDFDGVIADSEKLWVEIWRSLLKKLKNIVLTPEEELKLLVGVADATRKETLQKYFPNLVLDDDFMHQIAKEEYYAGVHYMQPIPGVQELFSDPMFDHCIATGATAEQHAWKMTRFKWIENYTKDYFTVDMVKQGKPAPDLFLLAAKSKHRQPSDCLVIEDSINGMIAAKKANIKCIAFVGAEGNNTPEYRKKCLYAGCIDVCETMPQLHQAIKNLFINK